MSKSSAVILCAIYAIVVVILAVLLFALPRSEFSPNENRMLSSLPRLSAEALADGRFFEDFSDFCADRFPLRDSLLRLNASLSLSLGMLENQGVMYGKDGNLIKRLELYDREKLDENLNTISNIVSYAESKGANAVFFCAPRALDALSSYCPVDFTADTDGLWEKVKAVGGINATELIRKKADSGEYVFFRTDHHWTPLGAYYAYLTLGEHLGYTPYPLSHFSMQSECTDFLGSSYSSSLFPKVTPDSIISLRYSGDGNVEVTDADTGARLGLYVDSSLKSHSKYDLFLGGNRARVTVKNGNGKQLILIKDSFANSLVPLLSLHFDVEVIDPRYLRISLRSLIDELYSQGSTPTLLVLFNPETLFFDAGLEKFG